VEYAEDDVAVLRGAYFCGPVLKEAARLREEDELVLDMTAQHALFAPDYYQATLRWKGVDYKADKIFLKESHIRGKYVNSIETLADTDFILINCEQHEEANHPFFLVYWAQICKEDREKKF
jgi:hypothetical protein